MPRTCVVRPKALLKLMRVEQWYKNALVVLPAVFSLKLADPSTYLSLLCGFLSLSLASSACYTFNDIIDLERDRKHPKKRYRPLPSGQVSVKMATALIAVLIVAALALALLLNILFALCVVLLIASSKLYSTLFKRIPVVDVAAIAFNYLLRAISGSFIVGVQSSPWLISGVFFLALFLALSKRKAELITAGREAREVLGIYTREWLNQALSMSAAMVIVTYAVYCAEVPLGHKLVPTVPLMAFFLLRYTLALEVSGGEQPHEVVLKDRLSLASAVAFTITLLLLIYA